MKYGLAVYSDDKYCFEIVGETEHEYEGMLFDEDKDKFLNGSKPFRLRKILFNGEIYEVVNENNKHLDRYKQQSLFDFI